MTHADFDRDTVVELKPSVLAAEVDRDLVLLQPDSGQYFSLNGSGAMVWRLLQQSVTLGAVQDALITVFDVDPRFLWDDLVFLVAELAENDLVVIRRPGS